MKSKGKVKLCFPTKKSKLPLEMRLRSSELRTPKPQRPPSLRIDLTMDSESEEEAAPSNAMQVSQSSFKPLSLSQLLLPLVGTFLWNRLCKPPLSCFLNLLLSSRNLIPPLHLIKTPTNAPRFIGPRRKQYRGHFHTRLRSHLYHPSRLPPLRPLAAFHRPSLSSLGGRVSPYYRSRITHRFLPAHVGTRSSSTTDEN
jgi:hypothetical protein